MKNTFIILFICLIAQIAKAQMSMAYSFGVMGGDLSVSNSSSPLTMNMNNCIQISNGIAKFSSVNNGSFVNTCVVDLSYSKMSIQLSPNPFIDAVYITFKSKIDKENHFKVAVFNNIGQLVKIENVYQDLFYTGYRLAMTNLVAGTYFLQISSSKVNEMFKIIKND